MPADGPAAMPADGPAAVVADGPAAVAVDVPAAVAVDVPAALAADVVAAVVALAAGAVVTVLVHVPRTRALVQQVDDGWYHLVQRTNSGPREATSRFLDVAFGTTVDWTVRVAVTAQLLRTRRWAALAGWAATVALGEVSVGPLKSAVDRARPGAPMTRTTMASYPSGHALAAATTAPGVVIALLPPGPQQRRLVAVAVPVAGAVALSRTFLNAHWLSDVVGGFALGTGYALGAPRLVQALRRPGPPTA
ncbi:MAG TPA: phosphatase PAP2 family protein [Mycobacteriales bacterium]|nr:phosphatase PAP2 family protein [Mycobacteriales bacterium]